MLSDRNCQLLTAYVDGRLSRRHREEAEQLLKQSPAARTLVQQLQDNIRRLQELPKHALEPEFSGEVLARIGQGTSTTGAAPSPRPLPMPGWMGLAIAASLLLGVTVSSYLYFSTGHTGDSDLVAPEQTQAATFAEFDHVAFRARVAEQAKKGRGVQLEIAYQDRPQAVERLQRAFQDKGIKLLPGPLNGNGEIVVFAENLTAGDVTGIVQQLAIEEKQSHQFGIPEVQPLTKKDEKRVANMLGLKTLVNEDDLFKNFIAAPGTQPKSKTTPITPEAPKERLAIAFAGSGAGQGTPAAIRDFLANRPRDQQRGAFRVVLVLRRASA